MKFKALAFDTGGTVLDWHSGLVRRWPTPRLQGACKPTFTR